MSVDNTAFGSVLTIPKELLSNLDMVDKKLKNIQTQAKTTSTDFANAFATMSQAVTPLSAELASLIRQLVDVKNGVSQIGQANGANVAASSITQLTELINKMLASLDNAGKSKGLEELGNKASKATVAMNDALNLATGANTIEKRIEAIKQLKEVRASLNAEEATYAQNLNTINNAIKKLDTANRVATDSAKGLSEAQVKNKQLSTYDQSLKVSQDADTIEKRTQAIKHLQRARAELSQTDVDYSAKLSTLNERIRQLNQQNKEAIESSRALNQQQKQQAKPKPQTSLSYGDSLQYAETANSIETRTRAIKYLREARAKLVTTDADYNAKLRTLNETIKQLDRANKTATDSARGLSGEYRNLANAHSGMLNTAEQLKRSFALIFSVSQVRGYVSAIAETRGYFELQQKSLQAILQNKFAADDVFNRTMNLALNSPFRAQELITFTKQLAAYRIESDKLFETTKRLADVSAGLGVDMQRLILAYGQVKAAAYLRGAEVRQFTEAGINMYGELQRYFSEVKGQDYQVGEIVDMISKRKVTFEDVHNILWRITEQGGLFYNMQAIQVETLQGKIGKMRDAFDQMKNAIGASYEGAIKSTLDGVITITQNWKAAQHVIYGITAALIAITVQQKMIAAKEREINLARERGVTLTRQQISSMKILSNVAKGLMANLKMGFAGFAIGAAISYIFEIIDKFKARNKDISEANDLYVTQAGALANLSEQYEGLAKSTDKAAASNKNAAASKRKLISDLMAKSNEIGLKIPVTLEDVKDEDLDKTFKMVKEKYEKFILDGKILSKRLADNIAVPIFDNIDDNAKDYSNAVIDALSNIKEFDVVIANVLANSKAIPEWGQKYVDILKAGKMEGESQLSYYTRMSAAIQELMKQDFIQHNAHTLGPKEWQERAKTMTAYFSGIKEQAEILLSDVEDIFSHLQGETDKNIIKAEIDFVANKQGWNDEVKHVIYRKYKIDVNPVIKETEKTIQQQLDELLIGKPITLPIKLKVEKDLDSDGAWHQMEQSAEDYLKKLKDYVEMRNRFNKGKITHDKYNANDVNANINKLADLLTAMGYADEVRQILTGDKRNAASIQRDIINEQINAYKELYAQYEKYLELYSKDEAKTKALAHVKDQLQNVGIYGTASNMELTPENIAKQIRALGQKYKEASKRGNALKIAADIELDIKKENAEKDLKKIEEQAEQIVENLQLFRELRTAGFDTDTITQLFGELPQNAEEANAQIEKLYANKAGEKAQKSKEKIAKKLNEDELKHTKDTTKKLVADYKTRLTEQLQLYIWYHEELRKINAQSLDDGLSTQLKENLLLDFNKKLNNIKSNDLQNSAMYDLIFGDIEGYSKRMLKDLLERVKSIKGQFKNDPEQYKLFADQEKKIQEAINTKNPFKALKTGLADYIKFAKQRKKLEDDISNGLKESQDLSLQIEQSDKLIATKEAELKTQEESNQKSEEGIETIKEAIKQEKARNKELRKQKKETDDNIQSNTNTLQEGINSSKKLKESSQEIGDAFLAAANGVKNLMSAFGVNSPGLEYSLSMVEGIASAFAGIQSGNLAATISGVMSVMSSIANLITDESHIDEELNKISAEITKLNYAVKRLEKSFTNALNSMDAIEATDKIIQKTNLKIQKIQELINAERKRKSPDETKIAEWEEQLKDLEEQAKEAADNLTESLGGLGSEANYKSAIQEMTDAWVDAFREQEDGLAALEDAWDKYIDNLIKKQLMMRVVSARLKPVLEAIDKALAEGSEGGNMGTDLTSAELEQIRQLAGQVFPTLNKDLTAIMEMMGGFTNASGELSALQQNIKGMTESTASALEALLNTIRFMVAQQTSDVTAIRAAITSLNVTENVTTPILTELKAQTELMRTMNSMFDGVRTHGHSNGGYGLKVFVNK